MSASESKVVEDVILGQQVDDQGKASFGDRHCPVKSRGSTGSVSSVGSSESMNSSASVSPTMTQSVTSVDIAPLTETTPDDIKNFCSTQACAQPDDVVTLARATLETLSELWREIGLEPHECNNSTAEMFAEVKRVFENKLSSTQEIKCSLVSQIRLASARITTIERETGTATQDSKLEACKAHTTLRASLSAHKEYLKSLEATKISRAGTLSKKADELSALFHRLDDSLTPEQTKFLKLGTDYTMGRIEQFVSRYSVYVTTGAKVQTLTLRCSARRTTESQSSTRSYTRARRSALSSSPPSARSGTSSA